MGEEEKSKKKEAKEKPTEEDKDLKELAERVEQLAEENDLDLEAAPEEDWVKITSEKITYEKMSDDEIVLYFEVEDYDSEVTTVRWFKDAKLLPDEPGTRYHNGNESAVSAQASNKNITLSLYIANLHEAEGEYACAVEDQGDEDAANHSESVSIKLTKQMIQECVG